MKHFFLIFITAFFPAFATDTILVSILPYKTIVEEIAGETFGVEVFVPPGVSAHTFEPTPRQMEKASQSAAWLMIGEPFEARAQPAFQRINPFLLFVDLRQPIDLIGSRHGECCGHHHAAFDPHFWLSPRRVADQVPLIVETLTKIAPNQREAFATRGESVQKKLQALDQEIAAKLQEKRGKIILLSHPAFGYWVNDFGIEQLSIEFEGRDPTPQQLTKLLQQAKEQKIDTVFIQKQHNTKGSRRVAEQLQAEVIEIDPFREDYFENLRSIAEKFAGS